MFARFQTIRLYHPWYDNAIRVYWDGKGHLYFENGKEVGNVPKSFIEYFPALPLDGLLL